MNQSFNKDNFIKIFYNENRKGNYVEGRFDIFNPLRKYTKQLEVLKSKFKNGFYKSLEIKKKANKVRKNIKKHRNRILEKILTTVEKEIKNNPPHITLTNNVIKGKTIYTVDRTDPYIFFMLKQLQNNIKSSFKVKQANRHEIVSQVTVLLDDTFPKYLIRTDIEDFYESIPHDKLFEKIKANRFINIQSIELINSIITEYKNLSLSDKGVPRGVGISAYLAELYLQTIDDRLRSFPNLLYYARYVDDLILIFTPNNKYYDINYKEEINATIEESGLNVNKAKTIPWDGVESNKRKLDIDFLGYNFHKNPLKSYELESKLDTSYLLSIRGKIKNARDHYNNYCSFDDEMRIDLNNNLIGSDQNVKKITKIINYYNQSNRKLLLGFTREKEKKYQRKIILALEAYNSSSKYNEKQARKLLINRFRYLTANTKLVNAKSDILIGIYFSNSLLSDFKCLKNLDKYLIESVNNKLIPYSKLTNLDVNKLKEMLKKFSFRQGFKQKTFRNFKHNEFRKILRIWKTI